MGHVQVETVLDDVETLESAKDAFVMTAKSLKELCQPGNTGPLLKIETPLLVFKNCNDKP